MKPTDGDFVLLKFKDTNDLSLKELTIDPPERNLFPLVPGKKVLPFSDKEHLILGVVALSVLYNRKVF